MKTAVFPGSFDPCTFGHIDIIKRSVKLFDKVLVVVMDNSMKKCLFTPKERAEMLKEAVKDIKNAEVDIYGGLLAEYIEAKSASAVVKGIRNVTDFDYEYSLAMINNSINKDFETVFLPAYTPYVHVSSTMVKELAYYGTDIEKYVTANVKEKISEKIKGGH